MWSFFTSTVSSSKLQNTARQISSYSSFWCLHIILWFVRLVALKLDISEKRFVFLAGAVLCCFKSLRTIKFAGWIFVVNWMVFGRDVRNGLSNSGFVLRKLLFQFDRIFWLVDILWFGYLIDDVMSRWCDVPQRWPEWRLTHFTWF